MQNIMQQGLDLMVIGMGTVFVFLTLLVLGMTLMSRIVMGFERRRQANVPLAVEPQRNSDEQELIAVITAAIGKHRAGRQ